MLDGEDMMVDQEVNAGSLESCLRWVLGAGCWVLGYKDGWGCRWGRQAHSRPRKICKLAILSYRGDVGMI